MTSTLLATAAALFAAIVYFANPASAGGNGAALNFGGPLGSFKAQQAGGETASRPRPRPTAAPEPRLVRSPAIANSARRQSQSVPVPVRSTEVAPAATDRGQTNSRLPTATVSAMAALDKPLSELADEARSGQAARAAEAAQQTCKKYVAAAGLTITVPCSM